MTNDEAGIMLTISMMFMMTMIQDGDDNDYYARMVMTMMTLIRVIMPG